MIRSLKSLFRAKSRTTGLSDRLRARLDVEALDERVLLSVAGYSAVGQKDFYVDQNVLWERDVSGNVRNLASSVSQVSVLQRDANAPSASARADVLMQNGDLKQWDDAAGWKSVAAGVKQVSAGFDGNSAVLLTNGNLYLYNTEANAMAYVQSGIASASLGLDHNSQAMIGMVATDGVAWEWRAAGGFEWLYSGIKQVSAGPDGHCALLSNTGLVYDHGDAFYGANGSYTGPGTRAGVDGINMWGTVASISCGRDNVGDIIIDAVYTNGDAWEYSGAGGGYLKQRWSNVVEMDAGWYGESYLLYASGTITRYNDNTGLGINDTTTTMVSYYSSSRTWGG
jgi:hypothetical protein